MAGADTRREDLRPAWIDSFIEDKLEWGLYDVETQRYRTCYAEDQKEAIKKAIEREIVPRSTEHVYPISGGSRVVKMKPEEFELFMQSLRQG